MVKIATSFNLIYEKFMEMISDSTLALLPDDDLKDILYQYLDRAKSIEFKQCKSNLNTIITSSHSQLFSGNGINTDFVINQPPYIKPTMIAKINNVVVSNYTYNEDTYTFHFTIPPSTGINNITLGWDFIGFEANLTNEEMWILACGMLIGWLEPKIKEEKLLKETIGSKDLKVTSHANQLKELMVLEDLTRARLKKYINSYTFNGFEGLS